VVTSRNAARMVSGETIRFVLTVEREVNRRRWAPGVTMFGRDVRATIGAVNAVNPVFGAGKRPSLVHIGPVERITLSARQPLIDGTCSTWTAVLSADCFSKVITAFTYTSALTVRALHALNQHFIHCVHRRKPPR
jgi:hypothetical protein